MPGDGRWHGSALSLPLPVILVLAAGLWGGLWRRRLALAVWLVPAMASAASLGGVALQDGDILVTRSVSPISGVYAQYDPQSKGYSHAAVFYCDRKGRPSVMQVYQRPRFMPLAGFFERYQAIAVMRARAGQAAGRRVGDTVRSWSEDRAIRRADFDPDMRDVPGRRDRFYCIGLINEAWRASGLAPPFAQPSAPVQDSALAVLRHCLGIDFNRLITANAIFANGDFEQVAEWTNPAVSAADRFMAVTLAAVMLDYLRSGYAPRPATGFRAVWRRGIAGVCGLDARADRALHWQAVAVAYCNKVEDHYARLERRGKAPAPGSPDAATLIRALCDRNKDDYFLPVCQVLPDGTVAPLGAVAP